MTPDARRPNGDTVDRENARKEKPRHREDKERRRLDPRRDAYSSRRDLPHEDRRHARRDNIYSERRDRNEGYSRGPIVEIKIQIQIATPPWWS